MLSFLNMFGPIHGLAPDIPGKQILQAMEQVMTENETLTLDLGGSSSTAEVGEAVSRALEQITK